MLDKKSSRVIIFLILPIMVAVVSFFYNFAGYLFSTGPLTLGHKQFDNYCFKCHRPLVSLGSSCLSCHEAINKNLKEKTGFHGNMNETNVRKCIKCHTDHRGLNFLIVQDKRSEEQFDADLHNILGKNNLSSSQETKYLKTEYLAMWDKISSAINWSVRNKILQVEFDHELTGYSLAGKHSKVKCEDCHKNIINFKESEKEGLIPSFSLEKVISRDFCYSCHKKDDASKHGHKGKYGKNCASCHLVTGLEMGWKAILPKIRGFHKKPGHQLIGYHKKVRCQRCHTTSTFKKTPEDASCLHCHEKLARKYHEESLGRKCEVCHTPESFRKSIFDHQKTKFALIGIHQKLNCQKCHLDWNTGKRKKKIYKQLKNTTCFDCHAIDDIHHGSFQKDCGACHKETYWDDVIQI